MENSEKSTNINVTNVMFVSMSSIVNITSALNKTSIVWQDVFDYHERVSTPQQIWDLQFCSNLHIRKYQYFCFDIFISLPHHYVLRLHQKFNYCFASTNKQTPKKKKLSSTYFSWYVQIRLFGQYKTFESKKYIF